MAATQIVCTNCGAKYKIPETFKGSRAKCKACGTVIDVAAQRAASTSAEPAAARAKPEQEPAAAKPARARPAAAHANRSHRATTKKRDEAAGARSSRRGSSARGKSSGHGKSSRRQGRTKGGEETSNKGLLIGGGLLVVALGVGGYFMFANGEDAPTAGEIVAKKAAAAIAERAAQAEADQKLAAAAQAKAEKAAKAEAAKVAALEAAAAKEAKAAEAAAKKRKKGQPLTDASQVYNPKTALEPVPWPKDVTEDEKTSITEMVENIANGGRAGIDAKKKLPAMGHKALAPIVNALREINYLDSFEVMTAWELNKFIEQITMGNNVGFKPTNLGEPVPLDIANWDALIVKTWRKFAMTFNTEKDWEKLMNRNAKKSK